MPLQAQQVSFAYARGHEILRGVTCAVRPGRVLAILGPNAAGKTTLLRVLLGALEPDAGRVLLGDAPLASIPLAARARRIAYVAQHSHVAFAYSLRQVVTLGARAGGGPPHERAAGALRRVGLLERADEPFAVLSAGQRQRGALARALAQLGDEEAHNRGKFLLADEPFSALDPRHVLDVAALLRNLTASGVGVAVVLHDLSLADRLADDALLLGQRGTLAASGSVADVLAPDTLSEVYGVGFTRLESGGARALAAIDAPPDR